MVPMKRIFCVLLALIFLLTAPGVVPVKTEAVAVADDVLIASLGLLVASWAGITFASNTGANTAIFNFLGSRPVVKSTLAALITKNLVVDGAKLLLTSDVRDSFKTVLPEIKDFFQTKTGESSGALSGAVSVGVPFPVPVCSSSDDEGIVSLRPGQSSSVSVLTSSGSRSVYPLIEDKTLSIYDSVSKQKISYTTAGVAILSYGFFIQDGSLYCRFSKQDGSRVFSSGKLFCVSDVTSAAATVLSDSNAIPFHQSTAVDGSKASSYLDSADYDSLDSSYDISAVTGVISNGVAGSTAAPGLSAEDLEKALANALAGTAVLPTTPSVTEPTATTPSEDGETQIVTPDILAGMFSGLKGWLESLLTSILAAIQAIGEKIDALGESIKSWWTETIADIKAWIEVKIQSIADWWTTFWADTIAAIKALGAAVTEFFTVTFPAWITDVKEWALSLPQTIIDAIIAALAAVFVPAAGYWDAKVAALQAKFPLFNSILTTGKGFSGFFSGLGSRPPVIYIDLGSSASWVLGGRTIFLDLTWYSNYKPTMDLIIAGFLWLLFAWRFFLRLPGLLRGEVGTIDRLDTYLDEKRKKNGG